MDTHEWYSREKLINWMETGQSTYWSLHRFEYALIYRALQYYKSKFTLNLVAQEVYDHIMMQYEQTEIPLQYPTPKALKNLLIDEE